MISKVFFRKESLIAMTLHCPATCQNIVKRNYCLFGEFEFEFDHQAITKPTST